MAVTARHAPGLDPGLDPEEPAFLRALDDANETFVADAHRTQRVWTDLPGLHVPQPRPGRGRPANKRQLGGTRHGGSPCQGIQSARLDTLRLARQYARPVVRTVAHRRIWVGDGEEAAARCWHLVVRREVGSPNTIKYILSNAPADTPLLCLAQMQGQRYWVERTFEDAKGECGLADYQALGWRAWHHHVTMVMLAMLFIAEQRAAHQPGPELLTPRDIVAILKETLPRKPQGKDALVARINQRHLRGRGAIGSRYRTQRNAAPS
jgi:SRSO17 transposase